MKIKGREDTDLDNLFRGKNENKNKNKTKSKQAKRAAVAKAQKQLLLFAVDNVSRVWWASSFR